MASTVVSAMTPPSAPEPYSAEIGTFDDFHLLQQLGLDENPPVMAGDEALPDPVQEDQHVFLAMAADRRRFAAPARTAIDNRARNALEEI